MSLLRNPHDEARARIIWGELPAEVALWLVMECGLTEGQAAALVRVIRKERAAEIRRSRLRTLGTGLSFLLLATISALTYGWDWKNGSGPLFHSRHEMRPVVAIFFGAWGFHKTVQGIAHLLSGRAEGSLTEMD